MKKKVGRPSKLSNKVIAQVEILAGLALTEKEIAQVIGVNTVTLYRWKTNKEFCNALKRGKAITDTKVTKSLVQRALGYSHKEITRESQLIKVDGEGKHTYANMITKIVDKQVAPDVVAQIFWLKNRRRDLWRDKETVINIEHNQFFNAIIAKPKLKDNKPGEANRVEEFSGSQN